MFMHEINTLLSESEVVEKLSIHTEDLKPHNSNVEIFFCGSKDQKGFTLRRLSDYSLNDRFGPEIQITCNKSGLYTNVQIRFAISKSDRKSILFICFWNACFFFIWGYFFNFESPSPYIYIGIAVILGCTLLFGFLTFYSKCAGNLLLLKRILQAVGRS